MALPGELWGRIGWRESKPVTTATGDDAAPAANDSTSRTEVSCRWVSGQFCESNSKGKWHCSLIKAISPQKNKVYQLCEQSLLQPSTVQSFRNLTKESCGFVAVSHGADQRQTKDWPLGSRGSGSTVPLLATLPREATTGSQRSPRECILPQALTHPGFPLGNFTKPGQQSPRSRQPQCQVHRGSLHQDLRLSSSEDHCHGLSHIEGIERNL